MNQNMVNECCEPVREASILEVAHRVSALARDVRVMAYAVHEVLLGKMPEATGRECDASNLKEELLEQADVLEDALKDLRVMLKVLGM